MIAINVEPKQKDSVARVMTAIGVHFLPVESDWTWAEKNFGVQGTPAAFLLDEKGRIMFRPSVHDAETRLILERQVEALLARRR